MVTAPKPKPRVLEYTWWQIKLVLVGSNTLVAYSGEKPNVHRDAAGNYQGVTLYPMPDGLPQAEFIVMHPEDVRNIEITPRVHKVVIEEDSIFPNGPRIVGGLG